MTPLNDQGMPIAGFAKGRREIDEKGTPLSLPDSFPGIPFAHFKQM
jgi:hypothetical protein